MKIRIWGCRGSLASPGPDTVKYGGNTSCVEVWTSSGDRIIFDAGTGIRALGDHIGSRPEKPIHLLLTHLHLDHIEGLGFFAPIWAPDIELHIWGPPSSQASLEENLSHSFAPPVFPVNLHEVPSHPIFHDVFDETCEFGSACVTAVYVKHKGPTVGYRIEDEGKVFVYMPDHEPSVNGIVEDESIKWPSGLDLAANADVLFHDCQYFDEEYPARQGWGHSSVSMAVDFSVRVGAKRFVMFHHDPAHTDSQVKELGKQAAKLCRESSGSVEPGYEGMEIEL